MTSDTERIDALGRPYTRRGPAPQPRHVIAAFSTTVKLTQTERELAVCIASEDETTVSDVMRESLRWYAEARRRKATR